MRRIAFFVEGYSELLFVDKLVTEIAGAHNVTIEQRQISGGVKAPRQVKVIKAADASGEHEFFVLIVDCGGETQVKTRLQEEHEGLTKAGYEKIVCIRDVRPQFSREEIPKLEQGMRMYVKGSLAPVDFILTTMELEAWFLAEFNHYEKIDPALTVDAIHGALGFHPVTDDPCLRDTPTEDLRICYAIAGKTYEKSEVSRTVESLDYLYIYTELGGRVPEVAKVIQHVDEFLSPRPVTP
ncbi:MULTISPECIES: hypothetical protein [unclassified Pseudomonas]|uniref:DUF4276 family protein n=1 Tax=Pseudomonas sp. 13.2 TaxID=3144665 RepID=A0AAU7BF43_9PSED|nr:hypothetical protein [Pseudomonas sp. SWI36]